MKEGNINIFKKSFRQRRAISSNIFENGSYNGSEEERNKSKNSIRSFHRKTTSSYFYGSYLSSNLEHDLLNNLNIDEINNGQIREEINDKNEKEKKCINSLNKLVQNSENNNLDNIFNVSFHSYELDNSNSQNNSVILKTEEHLGDIKEHNVNNKKNNVNKFNRNNNEFLLDTKENKFNTEKSFLSFKNNLKYVKDKEERATQSYLLALGMTTKQNKKQEKEQYLPTSSIIEEEKSDLIESKSEFSNKKRNKKNNYFFEDSLNNNKQIFFVKKENKLKIKNNIEEKNDHGTGIVNYINVNRNKMNNIEKNIENNKENDKINVELSLALNEIIKKNNKKEENKRKYLKKNKTILLNSFFHITYKDKKNKLIDKYNNKERYINKKDISKITENNNNNQNIISKKIELKVPFYNKSKKEYSYIANLIKKRFNTENSDPRRAFKNNILKNSDISYNNENKSLRNNNLNNSINSNSNFNKNLNKNITLIKKENKSIKSSIPFITKIEYKQRAKIPHLRQKYLDKNDNKGNNFTINKYTAKSKQYYTKILNIPHKKSYSFTKDKIFLGGRDNFNLHSMKQMKTINEALALIRIDRINSKKKNKTNNKTKNSNSSSFTGATRSNSKSSRSKEKKILIYKTNSSSLNYKNELSFNLLEEKALYPSNKKQTLIVLREKLLYAKPYIKNDVLEKIVKTFNSDNSFFIILCEKSCKSYNDKYNGNNIIKNSLNKDLLFTFKSLMKYYQNQNRFIKIYGDENAPNVISVKNIDINNYYIFKVKEKYKDMDQVNFVLVNELIFTDDAIIFHKKN